MASAAERPAGGPFSWHLGIGFSASRTLRNECLPSGPPSPWGLSRPPEQTQHPCPALPRTVHWLFSWWTPRVPSSCLDPSSHLPPRRTVSHPRTRLCREDVVQNLPHRERRAVPSRKRTGVLQSPQAPGPGKVRAEAVRPRAARAHAETSGACGLKGIHWRPLLPGHDRIPVFFAVKVWLWVSEESTRGRREGQDTSGAMLPAGRDLLSVTCALMVGASYPKSINCMFPF